MAEIRTAGLGGPGEPDLDDLLDRFEQAWQQGKPPAIEEFLPSGPAAGAPVRRQALEELIKLDLEYRWRQRDGKPTSERLLLEKYLARFPDLGPVERWSESLIAEEYRVRRRWGDRPARSEYAGRFPRQCPQLEPLFARIDAEMSVEYRTRPEPHGGARPDRRAPSQPETAFPAAAAPGGTSQPMASVAQMVELLRRTELLQPLQVDEVVGRLAKRHPAPVSLARELLQRSWLTAYQVNQILQGRGQDLVLGPYVLLERLGEGGAGQVYKARQRRMDRAVALKLIRKELLADPEMLGRFYREIQIISQLSHPNVVHPFDAGPIGATHVLAMEYVEGIDLGRLVKQSGPLAVVQACNFVRQTALGLQHAHDKGLVHRDIKPSNLLLCQAHGSPSAGLVKIADLGLARLRRPGAESAAPPHEDSEANALTPRGAVIVMGTTDYLAPEQALDFHAADIRADIYSLGCTLHYLLTGQPPFPGGTMAQKLIKHQQSAAPALDEFRSDVPAALSAVLRQMLAKRPEDRYQTPAEVAAALAEFSQAPAGTNQCRGAVRRLLGRRYLLGLAGTLMLIVAVAAIPWLSRPMPPASTSAPGKSPPRMAIQEHQWKHRNRVLKAAYSPDARFLASAGLDGAAVHVWDVNTGNSYRIFPQSPRPRLISSLAFSPDGQTLAWGTVDEGERSSIRVGDLATGKQLSFPLPAGYAAVLALAFGEKGQLLAAAPQGAIQLDPRTGALLGNVPILDETVDPATVASLAFAPDRQLLATGHRDNHARLWAAAGARKPLLSFTPGPFRGSSVNDVFFMPDGKSWGAACVNLVRVWDTSSGQDRGTFARESSVRIYCAACSADGKSLAAGCSDGSIKLWDLATGRESAVLLGHTGMVWTLAIAPDGKTLASGSEDASLRLWDLTKRLPGKR